MTYPFAIVALSLWIAFAIGMHYFLNGQIDMIDPDIAISTIIACGSVATILSITIALSYIKKRIRKRSSQC